MGELEQFLSLGVFAYMLTVCRIGAAIAVFPGFGDGFVPPRVRLFTALSISFIVMPIIYQYMPNEVPKAVPFVMLCVTEAIIGFYIGAIARVITMALDVGGMIISMQSGLANAQLFNPALASQGSLIGILLLYSGIMFIFATDLHHLMILGLVRSYDVFQIGFVANMEDLSGSYATALAQSFAIGFQIAAPFTLVTLVLYIGMGVLTRLMPQIQVFMIALPLQILIAFLLLSLVFAAIMTYWITRFEDMFIFFYHGGT